MKKYSRILYLIIILGLMFNIYHEENIKQIKRIVESKNYLTGAADAGFESEELYRCVLDTLGSDRTSATTEELAQITEVICRGQNITSTKGIEKLTSLRYLNLYDNKVTNMDLSKNTNLVMLNMTFNNLSSIDLSKNTNLQQLYLNGNNITSIDLSNNNKLIDLNLYNNKLTSINISNLTELKFLLLSLNNLTNLDLKNNTKLEHVYLSGNKLSSITMPTSSDNLTRLDLNSNKLTSIDLSKLINLNYLILSANELSTIDISNNKNLEYLYSSSNKLSSINLSNNTKLIDLDLYNNNLTSINASKLTNLKYLNVSSNNLSSLDLSNLTELNKIYASSNNLTSLNLENQNSLTEINAVFNKFDGYRINDKSKITYMVVEYDWLENLNLSEYTNLSNLDIDYYQTIPIYGNSIETSKVITYIPSNITLNQYKLYSGFEDVSLNSNSICNYEVEYTVDGSITTTEKTNINSCTDNRYETSTIEGEDGGYSRLQIYSDNMTINNVTTNANLKYDGYYEIRFIKLKSDKYAINEENNTIEVEADEDSTILKNLSTSWEDAKITINNNKLQISYNDTIIKEFTLIRITNPKTGSTYLIITSAIFIISLGTIMFYLKRKERKINE